MNFVFIIDSMIILLCRYYKLVFITQLFYLHYIKIILLKIVYCPVFKNKVN
jgi:hypothetical protein